MTKQYDPENFLIRSEEMTGEQYEVLKGYLAGFPKHKKLLSHYSHRHPNILNKNLWAYRGVASGHTVHADNRYGYLIKDSKPPVIAFKEFEENILNVSKETQSTFPDFDFKISCGDRPEVRQWLKDNGCVWKSGMDIVTFDTNSKLLMVNAGKVMWYGSGEPEWIDSELPELTPTIGVTGWTVEQKDSKEKLALQESISKMEQELEQMKQRVQEIK